MYVTALENNSRAPVVTLARQMSANGTPYGRDAIRDFLNVARRRKLLTRPRPGKADGKLTAKALRLLDDQR